MLIKYLKMIVFKNKIKNMIDYYEKHYHKFKSKQIAYYKERLTEKACYDCKVLRMTNKVYCKHNSNEKKDMLEVKNCKYYIPDKKTIQRNFLIKES